MKNGYVLTVGLIIVITVHSHATAQTGSSELLNGDDTTSLVSDSTQEDRRLSNRELREWIYALENRLVQNQRYLEQLRLLLQANQEGEQQLTKADQELVAKYSILEELLTVESDERKESQILLENRIEELIEGESSEIINRVSRDRDTDIRALSDATNEDIETLLERLRSSDQEIDDLFQSRELINSNLTRLLERVAESEVFSVEQAQVSDNKFVDLNNVISTRTLYGGVASAIFAFIILLLGLRMAVNRKALSGQLASSSESFQVKHNDLDLKLTQLLENQLQASAGNNESLADDEEPEHSFPLQVAAEIHRMRKRLGNMPGGTKGVQPLAKALERLEGGLQEKGYEIVELLGTKYNEGMTVQASFSIDDSLDPGEQIITNVNKPQVNYKTTVIQVADVEVSFGE